MASALGPDWVRGPDGVRRRDAARVLVFDEHDRLLLARGHDPDSPARTWWFTIGGGIERGESPRSAAIREVAEEAGLQIRSDELVGPVIARRARFDFFAETVRQDEQFFLTRIQAPAPLQTSGWTAIEQEFMDELRWWSLSDLAQVEVEVFPTGLADLAARLLWGWDGRLIHLADDHDQGATVTDR